MTHRFGIVGNGRGEEIAPEVDTSGSDDLDVFIARDDIDIITVATPSGLHHEAVMKAAAAGKHWGGSGLRGSQGGVRRVPGNPGIGKAATHRRPGGPQGRFHHPRHLRVRAARRRTHGARVAAAVAYTTQPIEMRMATRCRVTTTRIITAA